MELTWQKCPAICAFLHVYLLHVRQSGACNCINCSIGDVGQVAHGFVALQAMGWLGVTPAGILYQQPTRVM
jgi:hypothetical protein